MSDELKNASITIRCTKDLKEFFMKQAKEDNRTISNYIVRILEKEKQMLTMSYNKDKK